MYTKDYDSITDLVDQIVELKYKMEEDDFDYPCVNLVSDRDTVNRIVKVLISDYDFDLAGIEIYASGELYDAEYLLSIDKEGIWIEPAMCGDGYLWVEGITFVDGDTNSKFVIDNKDNDCFMIEFSIDKTELDKNECFIKSLYELDKNIENFAARLKYAGLIY